MNAVGIDFGTTNSAVAVYQSATGKVFTSDYEPTVIFFEESNQQVYHIGKAAIQRYVESGLKGRFIRSIKSVLHSKTFEFTYIYGRKYYAEDLVALILSHLAEKAEQILGERPQKVVLGRPAKFSPDPERDALAQKRLAGAAEKAGFSEVSFQLEPIAAAFSYESSISENELVFVGDFGGGTSDFTLMQLGPNRAQNNRMEDIAGASGVRVGGDDFDAEIAWGKVVRNLGYGLTYDSTG
ncbi:MAG: Hsp70 family protein, partial [Bacteroidota bacterium]